MCGIFGYTGQRKKAAEIVFDGLKQLEYRGYDSWGVGVSVGDSFVIDKHAGKIGNANVNLPDSSFSFGHTRWATHGGVTDKNSHPHLDCTKTIAVAHNGIIENYQEIRKKLLSKHRIISETDTEIMAHLIEEYREKYDTVEAIRLAFLECQGLSAFLIADAKSKMLIAVKTGSPLVVGVGQGENIVGSDANCLLSLTRNVVFLENNQLAVLTKDNVYFLDVKSGQEIKPKLQKIPWKRVRAKKGKYPYYMLKEIHEQPEIIADIVTLGREQAQEVAALIKKTQHIYMVGCGTASYAAIAGEYLFSKIARCHVNVAIGSEFGYHLDFLTNKSLVVAISQSGETMDILESVRKAKGKGATILTLVNVFGSTLYREADIKMLIGAGPEIGVASTKAFIGMLAHLILLAYALSGKTEDGAKALMMAVKSTRSVLADTNVKRLMNLAKKLKAKNHIYVIGRGLSYPAGLETALKIKEISYIHAEGLAAGELKHGTLALVTRGTPCIAFLPNDETYDTNLASTMEMKARGGYIIGISSKPHEVFDYFIKVDDASEATIIPNVVVGQLLAYYLTIERGFDPDMPRNLAKSVTVK